MTGKKVDKATDLKAWGPCRGSYDLYACTVPVYIHMCIYIDNRLWYTAHNHIDMHAYAYGCPELHLCRRFWRKAPPVQSSFQVALALCVCACFMMAPFATM